MSDTMMVLSRIEHLEAELAMAEALISQLKAELNAANADANLQRTRLGSILFSGVLDKIKCGDIQQWADEFRAERQALTARIAELEALNASR
jgi:uncharacterized coiled-coil protein SlyX